MKENCRIRPRTWLLDFLKTQMKGLTGHIEEAGFPYDTVRWGGEEFIFDNGKPEWWVYEQTAYWVDGFVRTAILLDDTDALARAEKIIYGVIDNPDADGYLGPRVLKEGKNSSRWPHVVFFRACMALYEYKRDERIVLALVRHYLNEGDLDHVWRDVNNVEIMLWLYDLTGDKRLLDNAEVSYRKYNDRRGSDSIDKVALSRRKPYEHGVSHNEYSKLGAILYKYTGKEEYLKASVSAYRKIDRFFMLPGGCLCSDEHMRDNTYTRGYETCNISDMTWSLSYLLSVTDKREYADKIERCIFNAGLGSVTEDFKALQYYSSANIAVSDASSNHNNRADEASWMRYSPSPGTECCPGNVNRFMPNYVFNMWQKEGSVITSRLFGPSEFSFFEDGCEIVIVSDTSYPFEDTVRYTVKTNVPFTLRIRRPEWALSTTLTDENGKEKSYKRGDYIVRKIEGDTTLTLRLEYDIKENKSGEWMYLSRGPLVFSLLIDEKRTPYLNDKTPGVTFPDYSIRPASEWRYALSGEYSFSRGSFTSLADRSGMPFISASAVRITNFAPEENDPKYGGKIDAGYDEYTFTPRLLQSDKIETDGALRTVRLLPYGACKLRMTVLNKI